MATPYDLSCFFEEGPSDGDKIFIATTGRNITVTEGFGKAEITPSEVIDLTVKVNSITVSGSSATIETDGTVLISFNSDIVLGPGDKLEVFVNDTNVVSSGVQNIAITFIGELDDPTAADNRYDIAGYNAGAVAYGQSLYYAVCPREFYIDGGTFNVGTAPDTQTTLYLKNDDTTVGNIVISTDGSVAMTFSNSTHAQYNKGDVIQVDAPSMVGQNGNFLDPDLKDIAISLTGQLGVY